MAKVVVLAAFLTAALAFAVPGCGSSEDARFAASLRSRLANQYHQCVPLGWRPVVLPWGGYYPGYDASTVEDGVWLQALWIGTMRKRDEMLPDVHRTAHVLDGLVQRGLLERIELRDRFRYHLTPRGARYYYDDDRFGNNPEHWPYLCFSRLVPERIVADARSGHVTFVWSDETVDAWATRELQRYAIVLAPVVNPAAIIVRPHGRSLNARYALPLPSVVSRSAWVPRIPPRAEAVH